VWVVVHVPPLSLYLPSRIRYIPAERAETLPPISPLPLYVLCGLSRGEGGKMAVHFIPRKEVFMEEITEE
jgi:hypothetical protein